MKPISACPELLAEWHFERNGSADKYSIGSNTVLWWLCPNGHEFQGKPNNRSQALSKKGRISECPMCRKERLESWTLENIITTASQIKDKFGYLPSPTWFSQNGYSAMISALYTKHKHSWPNLRHEVEAIEAPAVVGQSRVGLRWRSKAEACLSDFLYARGVEHQKGRKYPQKYAEVSGKKYGMYDMHFRRPGSDEWIDVEVWGGHPGGAHPEEYQRVKQAKILFNKGNTNFFGVNHDDCYKESKLEILLVPYIGKLPIINYNHELDRVVPTSHWSTYKEVLKTCQAIADQQPNGKFPSENWLGKNPPYENRDGNAYPSLMDAIRKHFGSVNELRKILGQPEYNRSTWPPEKTLQALDEWMKRYKRTPGSVMTAFKKGDSKIAESQARHGAVIATFCHKHFGGVRNALRTLGYETKPQEIKSTPLEHIHKITQQIDAIARSLADPEQSKVLRNAVKKIYYYSRILEKASA